ncbi:UNVERIFIED_CONTAM: hypothetical protein Scaly_2563000 [Sesamum calycinum]|uniref:Uncharacterized protein n=1 Tax=Sesamum calycinum TaxID=2727403 RepID=A0AAW2K7X6_9LAMI
MPLDVDQKEEAFPWAGKVAASSLSFSRFRSRILSLGERCTEALLLTQGGLPPLRLMRTRFSRRERSCAESNLLRFFSVAEKRSLPPTFKNDEYEVREAAGTMDPLTPNRVAFPGLAGVACRCRSRPAALPKPIISVPRPHCWKGSASKPYVELPPHTAPLGMEVGPAQACAVKSSGFRLKAFSLCLSRIPCSGLRGPKHSEDKEGNEVKPIQCKASSLIEYSSVEYGTRLTTSSFCLPLKKIHSPIKKKTKYSLAAVKLIWLSASKGPTRKALPAYHFEFQGASLGGSLMDMGGQSTLPGLITDTPRNQCGLVEARESERRKPAYSFFSSSSYPIMPIHCSLSKQMTTKQD